MIKFAAICPHPAIIIPGIAKEKDFKLVSKTVQAMNELSEEISKHDIDIVIIISPHGIIYPDRMNIWSGGEFYGKLSNDIEFDFCSYDNFVQKLIDTSEENGIKTNNYQENFELDNGVLVPMYYLRQHLSDEVLLVPINYSMLDRLHHYSFGQTIFDVCNSEEFQDKNIAIIASGDLSHRLFEGEMGKDFDKKILDDLKNKDTQSILETDENLIENARECGYNSILILLGAIEQLDYQPQIISYEGTFGIGYAVVNFNIKTS